MDAIHMLYNGSVYYREDVSRFYSVVDKFFDEIDNNEPILVYQPRNDTFYVFEQDGYYCFLPKDLYPAAYELMGIKKKGDTNE